MAEILVLSKQNNDTNILANAIASIGHKVRVIDDVSDAKLLFDAKQPDLVIAEQEMPEVTGLEFFKYVKAKFNKIPPFILMCDMSLSASAGKALQMGALDFLPKPIDAEEATHIITQALNRRPLSIFSENQISFEADEDILIIKIPEQFLHESAIQLSKLLHGGGVVSERGVIVDLSQNKYMASIGIGMLQMLAANCNEDNVNLYMCGAGLRIYHLLDSAGVFHFYKYEETLLSAIEKIKN